VSGARGLSATEALLAQAAAVTPAEVHAARLALIYTGGDVVKPLDRTLLTSGTGCAGRTLLGGSRPGTWGDVPGPSAAIRSARLLKTPPTPVSPEEEAC
jgi:hypothetical protein